MSVIIRTVKVGTGYGELLDGVARAYKPGKNRSTRKYNMGLTEEDKKTLKEIVVDEEYADKYSLTLIAGKEHTLYPHKNERDFIDYKFALMHKKIANNKSAVNSSHDFYIVDEEEEAKEVSNNLTYLKDAYVKLDDMGPTERREFLTLFGIPSKESSDDVVIKKLKEQVDNNPESFVRLYDDVQRKTKVLLNQLEEYGIIVKRGISYYHNENLIGTDYAAAIVFLEEPKNQSVKIQLRAYLEETKKI